MCDIYSIIPAVSGKIELVYEGEQEGPMVVAHNLIGQAINKEFLKHFPAPVKGKQSPDKPVADNPYEAVVDYFSSGRKLEISDDMSTEEYHKQLNSIAGLKQIVKSYFDTKDEKELALRMEFVLEGLHQNNLIAREMQDTTFRYSDVFSDMLKGMGGSR
jgi:magnesium chelatase subunit I